MLLPTVKPESKALGREAKRRIKSNSQTSQGLPKSPEFQNLRDSSQNRKQTAQYQALEKLISGQDSSFHFTFKEKEFLGLTELLELQKIFAVRWSELKNQSMV